MKKPVYAALLAVSVALAFLAGSWRTQGGAIRSSAPGAPKILYYVDPMNPAHTSDKPGSAPCGMPMEPVYADDDGGSAASLPPGAVKISAEKQQIIGVRVTTAEETSETMAFQTLGRVVPDERLVYRINASVEGWIVEASNQTTGSRVKKNDVLATFSTSELITAAQQYIFALDAMDRLIERGLESPIRIDPVNTNFRERIERLRSLGMSDAQMEETKGKREIPRSIKILAPGDGYVLARNVSRDQSFDKGAELFRIADLNRVWVVANVFEREARQIQPGMSARLSLSREGKTLEGKVSEVIPQYDAATRSYGIRVEVDNPEMALLPDAFVDVEFLVPLPPAVTIPVDALINSGTKKIIYVDLGDGHFESREVKTGRYSRDRVQIIEGLTAGEDIVFSGNFLVDSESRMKMAAKSASKPAAPSMSREAAHAGDDRQSPAAPAMSREAAHSGHDRQSPAAPAMSPENSGAPEPASAGVSRCPVCKMAVSEKKAKAKNLTGEFHGQTYHFCSKFCRDQFAKRPQHYSAKTDGAAAGRHD